MARHESRLNRGLRRFVEPLRDGYREAALDLIPGLVVAAGLLGGFYLSVRTLKKRRQLVAD